MKALSQIAICLLVVFGSLAFGDLVIAQNSIAAMPGAAAKEKSLEEIVVMGARISGQLLSFAPLIVLAGPGAGRGELDVVSLLVNRVRSIRTEPAKIPASEQFHWAWVTPLGAIRNFRRFSRRIKKRVRMALRRMVLLRQSMRGSVAKRIANWMMAARPCLWLESTMRFLLPARVYKKHLWNVISDHQIEYEQALGKRDYGHALWITVRCYFLVSYILFIFILVLPPFLYSLIARFIRYLLSD